MSVHLVILIHGLYGSPANLAVVQEELIRAGEVKGDDRTSRFETVVHVCKSFTGSHTWDGIDINALRASQEIDQIIDKLGEEGKTVDRFSVLGYSLGGCLLHSRSPSFFDKHKPSSFSTAATPHLGTLKYGTTVNTIVHTIGRRLFSRSGQQLYCLDQEWDGRSLLEVIADPRYIFLQALQIFPAVTIAANGCHDLTVPYPTATFSLSDPFEAFEKTGMRVDIDENHIVKSWHYPDRQPFEVVMKQDEPIRRRPRFPPFLFLPYPFTYLLFLLLPFILPLWLCVVTFVLTLHTFQSRRRHRSHSSILSSLTPSTSSIDLTTPLLQSNVSHPRLEALKRSSLSIDNERSGASTPSINSGTSTPPLYDIDDAPEDIPPRPGQAALLLTPAQKRMCRQLQDSLPHAERVIAWYPWAFNAHALLVARDVRRFKAHEEGRGLIRQLARGIIDSAYEVSREP